MEQRDINSRTRADTFGLRPDLFDALAGNMVKQSDLDSLLPNYGSVYCSKGGNGKNMFIPFDTASEAMRGCSIADTKDGIRLDAVGQWEIMCIAAAWSNALLPSNSELRVELWSPEGVFVKRQVASVISPISSSFPVTVIRSFVVDRPGYVVKAWVNNDGGGQWNFSDVTFMSASYKYNGNPLGGV